MIRSTYWVNHNLVLVTLRASERCSPPNLHVFCNPSVRHYFTPVLWPGSLAVYRRLYLPRASIKCLRFARNKIGRRICLDKAFLFVNFLPRALLNEAILSSPPLTPHASAFSTVKPCVFCLSCHFALSLPTTTVQLRIRGIYIHGENLHACKPFAATSV